MKLYIDTSDNRKIVIGLDDERWQFKNQKPRAQKLLSLINQSLKKKKLKLNNLKEIKVNLGPGSFTGLRVGLSVANALGWALDIPVNGRKEVKLPKYGKSAWE